MATLFNTKTKETITDFKTLQIFFKTIGVDLEKWETSKNLTIDSTQCEILAAYSHELKPYMDKNGYKDADVINVHPKTENLKVIREKFMKEHTHSDDEVRFFVDGAGVFWFNLENDTVLSLKCEAGDFISVPKNVKHWFDLHPDFNVKCIRVFSNTDGWTPNYTNSNIDQKYNP
jgi:1,2-dihydroxy-3-keto-5-methylthiopentene dioxygenase